MKALQHKNIMYLEIRGNNNHFGNPNAIYRIFNKSGDYLGYTDDDYSGTNFIAGRKVKNLGTVYTNKGIQDLNKYKRGVCFENKGL